MEKPAVWAEADVGSLAAALMVQRPPARPRMRCSRPSVCTTGSASSIEEDLLTEAACNGILSGMLERCYERSERDLARLRMALERAAQLRKRTKIFAGERIDELGLA